MIPTVRSLAWMLVIAGCGRSGFDAIDSARSTDVGGGSPLDPFDAPAGAIVVTLGERPTSTFQGVTSDTYLSNDLIEKTYNYGASRTLAVESAQANALLRFDLAAIPPGTTIAAARLHLWVVAPSPSPLAIAPVAEAWSEGASFGTAGLANWTQRTSSQAWTSPGAGTGGSAGATIASFPAPMGAIGVDLPASMIQGWVNTPSTNFGVVITPTGISDSAVASRDALDATTRPELVVTYFP